MSNSGSDVVGIPHGGSSYHFTVCTGSVGDFALTTASWSSGAATTSEAGAFDFGTVVTALASGGSGSEACEF